MNTRRKALSRQEEPNLQLVLQELKVAKDHCAQLENEREENERELLGILDNNSKLKTELSRLHIKFKDIVEERDRLQSLVDTFDQCSDEYDRTLRRTTLLEQELRDAHQHITDLELSAQKVNAQKNDNLFNELMSSAPQLVTSATIPNIDLSTIDLTNDNSHLRDKSVVCFCSRNKLKKYIKINRFIKKSKKQLKYHKNLIKKCKNVKSTLKLREQAQLSMLELKQSHLKYQTDTQYLESKIKSLQHNLQSVTNKYELSLKEMNEYSLAMDDVLKTSKYNWERYNSILNNHSCNCIRSSPPQSLDGHGSLASPESQSPLITLSPPSSVDSLCDSLNNDSSSQIIMFSDDIGIDMGSIVRQKLTTKGLSFINNCYPCANLKYILHKIYDYKFHPNSQIIIFIANRGNVSKDEFMLHCEKLMNLDVKRIVMFTLPYIKNLPDAENNYRYKFNLKLDIVSKYNKKFHVIDSNSVAITKSFNYNNMNLDSNKIVSLNKIFYLTKGRYNLPKYYKRQIATSLSYFIHITANNLAKQSASIEQNNSMNNKTLEFDPNNLN